MSYDDAYKKSQSHFGNEPTDILRDHIQLIDKSKPVLDIGAGQGRNTLFLARNGFTVDAIDPSAIGIRQIANKAAAENLKITTIISGFEDLKPQSLPYSAILVFGIIQVLPWESIGHLVDSINAWTAKDSPLFISAFSTEDPAFPEYRAKHVPAGKNSFYLKDDSYRTYLEPNQILTLFSAFTPVFHWEGLGPVHDHGDNDNHRHALIHFVGKRTG